MEAVWNAIKSHPYITGGGVAILIILMYLRSAGSSSGGTGNGVISYTTDPNVIAANTAVSVAQLNSQAAIAIDANDNQTTQHLADVTAQTSAIYIGAAQDVANKQTAGAVIIADGSNSVLIHQSDNAAATDKINARLGYQTAKLMSATTLATQKQQLDYNYNSGALAAQQLMTAMMFYR